MLNLIEVFKSINQNKICSLRSLDIIFDQNYRIVEEFMNSLKNLGPIRIRSVFKKKPLG